MESTSIELTFKSSPPSAEEQSVYTKYQEQYHAWCAADAALQQMELAGECPELPDARMIFLASGGARSRVEKGSQTKRRLALSDAERAYEYDVLEQAQERLKEVLEELEASDGVETSYRRGKEARMESVYHCLDSALSVLNEVGSAVFTFVTLRAFSPVLFILNVAFMLVNAILRFLIATSNRHAVDTGCATRADESTGWTDETVVEGPDQRYMFWTKAVPLYLLEPHVGRLYIASSLPKSSVAHRKSTATAREATFTRDIHPLAVGAVRSTKECATDIRTSLLLVGIEDLPELGVELAYLLMAEGSINSYFLISAAGTLMSVARQVYELYFDVIAWPDLKRAKKHIDVTFHSENDSKENLVSWAVEYGELCRILELLNCKWVDAHALEKASRLCPYLDELNLDGCTEIEDDALVSAASGLRRLHKLKLNRTRVGDAGALAIAENCCELRVFFAPKTLITDKGFIAISQNCPYLTSISIVETESGNPTLEAFAQNNRRCLYAVYAGSTQITDEGMKVLAVGCPNLGLLTCPGTTVSDVGIIDFVQHCQTLLMLTANSLFTERALLQVVKNSPNLRVVWCSSCNVEKGGTVDADGWARLDEAAARDRVFRR